MTKELIIDDYGISSNDVRLMPCDDGNILCSKQSYIKEIAFRRDMNKMGVRFDLPSWDQLKRYEVA